MTAPRVAAQLDAKQVWPFIAIEGQDGTGKTTLRKGLFRLFSDVFGVTPLSILTTNFLDHRVAAAIVDGKYSPSPHNVTSYLDALRADKRATVERLIRPALAGRPVIADRWLLSEIVFFRLRHGRAMRDTHDAFVDAVSLAPLVTFVLDLPPTASTARASGRSGEATRADWDDLSTQTRLHAAYLSAAAMAAELSLAGTVRVLDASRGAAGLLTQAWTELALLWRGVDSREGESA